MSLCLFIKLTFYHQFSFPESGLHSITSFCRRTLPRPPSWPQLNKDMTGTGRWKFPLPSAQDHQTSSLESQLVQDMHTHLADMDTDIAKNVANTVSKLVPNSVKFLQNVYAKSEKKSSVALEELKATANEALKEVLNLNETLRRVEELKSLLTEATAMAREVQAQQNKMTERLNDRLQELKDTSAGLSNIGGSGRSHNIESVDDCDDSESDGPLFRLPSVRSSSSSTPKTVLSSKLSFVGLKREAEHHMIVIDDDIW